MAEHTPTPLTVKGESNGTFVYSPRGRVASMEAGYQQTRDADAEFIVRACNAHDALVAALTKLATVARYYHKGEAPGHEDSCENPDNCGHCLTMREVATAIEKATA